MCLAQGPQRSDAGEARTRGHRFRVMHSTNEPLRFHTFVDRLAPVLKTIFHQCVILYT